MRKLGLLIAAGSLWLFLAAVPALADGGPHIASVNSGTSTLTADSCAGCHRAHTAQGEYLLAAPSEQALCLSCHGAGIAGATTNVEDGVQYLPNVSGMRDGTGTVLGALRDGGFKFARIGANSPSRQAYPRGYEDSPYNTVFAISQRPKVPVGASEAVNSAHIDLTPSAGDGIADQGTMWGSGAAGQLGAADVHLSCVECHNPHGNDAYRILRSVPGAGAGPLGTPKVTNVRNTFTNFDTIVTTTQHALTVGDEVTLTNVGGLTGKYTVVTVTNGFTFKVGTFNAASSTPSVTNLTDAAGGTVSRIEFNIADSPTDWDGDGDADTKNYTVMQTKGVQGSPSSFLLFAQDVMNTGGTAVPAGPAVPVTAIIADGANPNWLETTGVATGLAVGDLVTITDVTSITNGTYTVSSIGSSGAVYDRFKLYGQNGTAVVGTSTVSRNAISGNFTDTGGDYLRRVIPWNPALQNPGCDNTVLAVSSGATANLSGSACATMNDAPNGRPGTITNGPTTLVGQQAFLDQMSTWCASCHTRYYVNSNENTGAEEIISRLDNIGVSLTASNDRITPVTYAPTSTQYGSPSYGDKVDFAGTGTALDTGEWFVIATGGRAPTAYFQVSDTLGGTAFDIAADVAGTFTKVYQSSASGWGYPRSTNGVEDDTYKYQHSTASNRACTVCHVGHGSNAEMNTLNGTDFSLNVPYPDRTTVSTSSRLLKVDNRGTCQMCHDPTGTIPEGVGLPNSGTPPTVGGYIGNTQIP